MKEDYRRSSRRRPAAPAFLLGPGFSTIRSDSCSRLRSAWAMRARSCPCSAACASRCRVSPQQQNLQSSESPPSYVSLRSSDTSDSNRLILSTASASEGPVPSSSTQTLNLSVVADGCLGDFRNLIRQVLDSVGFQDRLGGEQPRRALGDVRLASPITELAMSRDHQDHLPRAGEIARPRGTFAADLDPVCADCVVDNCAHRRPGQGHAVLGRKCRGDGKAVGPAVLPCLRVSTRPSSRLRESAQVAALASRRR